MRFNLNSIHFKIKVLHLIMLSMVLFLYCSVLSFTLNYMLYRRLDDSLRKKAQTIQNTITAYLDKIGYDEKGFTFAASRIIKGKGRHHKQNMIWAVEGEWLRKKEALHLSEDYVDIQSPRGDFLFDTFTAEKQLRPLIKNDIKQAYREQKAVFRDGLIAKEQYRIMHFPAAYRDTDFYIIQLGSSLEFINALSQERTRIRFLLFPLILFFAYFIDRLLVVRILTPVMEVTKAARRITSKDLSQRVTAEHIDIEMQYLVDSFNDMISRLEASFHYIEEFSASVAHELKTPLSIIKGETGFVLQKEQPVREYQRVLGIIAEEVERMSKTINDMLLLTRLDYHSENIEFEDIDIKMFLTEIFEQGKLLAQEKNITMYLRMGTGSHVMKIAKLHLRRVFFNIIHNAIKFTPAGGKIIMKNTFGSEKLRVTIADTGTGILPEDLPRIFDKFFKKKVDEQSSEPGNGLGLSIAQLIVKMHGGTIRVRSTYGKGAVFSVFLPLSQLSA